MLALAEVEVEAAASVTFFEVPGVTLTEAGDAVTPDGRPETETDIDPLKELIAAAETVMSDGEPPGCSVRVVGETEKEKSGEEGLGVLDFTSPHEVKRMAQLNSKISRYMEGKAIRGDL